MIIAQIELLENLAENGIIAAAFLYILYWLLNKQALEVSESTKSIQLTSIEVGRSIRSLTSVIMGMQQQLMAHDLTVSGLNPAAGATFEERDSLAFKKYTDVMKLLQDQRDILHQINDLADRKMVELRDKQTG